MFLNHFIFTQVFFSILSILDVVLLQVAFHRTRAEIMPWGSFLKYSNWFLLAQIRQQVRFYVTEVYRAHSRSAFLNLSATQEELMLLEIP